MSAQELPAKAPDKEISSWTLGIDIAIPNVNKTRHARSIGESPLNVSLCRPNTPNIFL